MDFYRNVAVEKLSCNWHFFERVNDKRLRWHEKEDFKVGDQVTKGDFFEVHCEDGKTKW
jgi:hypothetical protein